MEMDKIQDFFFWCFIVNLGIYLFTVLAILSLRDFYVGLLMKLFGLDEQVIRNGILDYLGRYKILITVFSFVPWLSLLILNR